MIKMNKKIILNLACGNQIYNLDTMYESLNKSKTKKKDYEIINIDINSDSMANMIHDIYYGLPFNNEWIEEIICEHYIEHLDDKGFIRFFNECWRVLKIGGLLKIKAPYYRGKWAFIDPTHKKLITEYSFDFFLSRDYNSITAGVTGWYKPLLVNISKNNGEIKIILKKLK